MLSVGFFQAHQELRKQMRKAFKEKGYTLKEKRFVVHEVLGYTPYFSEMTISEMEQVIDHLQKTKEKTS